MNSDIFTKNGKYLMLAFDQRRSYRKLISPKDPDNVDLQLIIKTKGEILAAVYEQLSGLLLDFDYGLPAYKLLEDFKKPLLLPAEKSGYTDEEGDRVTVIRKSAEDIKNEGAQGIKLLIWHNPESKTAQTQIEIARKVLENAHANNLPLFLEILNYNIKPRVYDSVKEFLDAGVIADLFKLEFPGSVDECKKITDLLQDTPWITLTKGVEFKQFKKQLKACVKGGCSGFLAGRALFKKYFTLKNQKAKEKFLTKTLPKRFETISDIVLRA